MLYSAPGWIHWAWSLGTDTAVSCAPAAFKEDVHAWHTQLGANAAGAQLTAVSVPSDQAQWILPGAEYNKGSYWRVYGATLRYQVDGRAGTFAVASMISWRGEWYVVHLASIR